MEKLYDANQGGDEASCLVCTTPDDLGVLFKDFSEWKCDKRNFDGLPYALRMGFVSRLFLYTIARFAGLDLHITAKISVLTHWGGLVEVGKSRNCLEKSAPWYRFSGGALSRE
jgi:hypothetical protein